MNLYRLTCVVLWVLSACQPTAEVEGAQAVEQGITTMSAPSETNLLMGPAGLTAAVYHRAVATMQNPPNSSAGVQEQVTYATLHAPTYTYTVPASAAWSLNFSGGDNTPTEQFLGGSAAGVATQDTAALQTTLIDLTGFVHFTSPGTYMLRIAQADDAVAVYFNGNGTPGSGTLLGEQFFTSSGALNVAVKAPRAGWYPIELFYYNATIGGAGGAGLSVSWQGNQPTETRATVPTVTAPQGTPGLGLRIYHRGEDASQVSPPTVTSVNNQMAYAAATTPNSTSVFTATQGSINLGGGDTLQTDVFLGTQASGPAASDVNPLQTTILDFVGYLQLPTPGTYSFNLASADDAAFVMLGGTGVPGSGVVVAANSYASELPSALGVSNPTAVQITQAGWYRFEMFYYNQYYGGSGGANINLAITGPSAVQWISYGATTTPMTSTGSTRSVTDPVYNPNLPPYPIMYSAGDQNLQRTAGTAMQSAFNQAMNSNPASYTIPSGVYRIQTPIVIANTTNFTLNAANVEIIMEGADNWLRLLGNTNFTLTGPLTLDASPFSFTQGTLVAFNAAAQTIDVQLMPNYPTPVAGHRVAFFNSAGIMQPHPQDSVQSVTALGNNTYRLLMNSFTFTSESAASVASTIAVGNYVSMEQDGRGAFEMRSNNGVHMTGINAYMGALVWAMPELGDDVFEQFSGTRRPGTNRLTGGAWFLMSYQGGSFTLKDSEVAHNFDDLTDINIVSDAAFGWVDTTHLYVTAKCAAVGTQLDFYNYVSYQKIATAKVTALQTQNTVALAAQWQAVASKYNVLNLGTPTLATLDTPVPASDFYYVDCVSNHMKAATFINNYLHDGLSDGIAAKGANRIIAQNNVVKRVNGPGIDLGFGPYWFEGGPSANITVTDNTVTDAPYAQSNAVPAIFVYAGGSYNGLPPQTATAQLVDNVDIENNLVERSPIAGVSVANAQNITIKGNYLDHVDLLDRGWGAISLDAVSAAQVSSNTTADALASSGSATIWSGPRSSTAPLVCNNATVNPNATAPNAAWQAIYVNDARVTLGGSGWTSANSWPNQFEWSTSVGASASASFTGVQFRVVGARNTGNGLANVYVDGTLVGTMDGSALSNDMGPIYLSPKLAVGTHQVRLVVTGKAGAVGSGTALAIASFDYLAQDAVSCP